MGKTDLGDPDDLEGARRDPGAPRHPHVLDELRSGTTKSLNAALIEQLRADLLRGIIAPNIKLKIPDICARYGVSPGVAREALSRLVPEGLIDFTDQRGFRTPPLTAAGVRDITRARLLIEREAMIDAMRHGTDEWEADIIAAQHRLQSTERGTPENFAETDEFSLRHREFHRALIAACTSPWLIRMHNMLYDQTERYRFIAARNGNRATGRRRAISNEHSDIAQAVINRDEVTALQLMEDHLKRTADRALAAAAFAGTPGL
ncbi:MAG: FCD domain-containing protein [Pseudomonadota bacterium]